MARLPDEEARENFDLDLLQPVPGQSAGAERALAGAEMALFNKARGRVNQM